MSLKRANDAVATATSQVEKVHKEGAEIEKRLRLALEKSTKLESELTAATVTITKLREQLAQYEARVAAQPTEVSPKETIEAEPAPQAAKKASEDEIKEMVRQMLRDPRHLSPESIQTFLKADHGIKLTLAKVRRIIRQIEREETSAAPIPGPGMQWCPECGKVTIPDGVDRCNECARGPAAREPHIGEVRVMGAVEKNIGEGWDYYPITETRRGFTRWFVQTFQSMGEAPDGIWRDTPAEGFETEAEAVAATELPDEAMDRSKAVEDDD